MKRPFLCHLRPELDADVPRPEGRLNYEAIPDALMAHLRLFDGRDGRILNISRVLELEPGNRKEFGEVSRLRNRGNRGISELTVRSGIGTASFFGASLRR